MTKLIKSAGGIIYYYDKDGSPRFLLIKRHAVSGKVERVAPKGKLQYGENYERAALREVAEETGIPINQLSIVKNIGTTKLLGLEDQNGKFDKEVTYFLMRFVGDPSVVDINLVEGYLGTYKRATISDVLNLVYYADIREIFREGYNSLKEKQKINDVKRNFINSL